MLTKKMKGATASVEPDYPEVQIVKCDCDHTYIWDVEDTDRKDPWGCSNCGNPAEIED